ncbi:MAG: glycosyltransferase family 2 protein [Candidatus Melainabacteria bacterium]|nr:glycosyltransferase family 2 protein [Candidatus Melainabacteria bacterium]
MKMQNNVALSVVMITLNEQDSIRSVVESIREVIEPGEILIVDSSADKTAEIATTLGCRVIRQLPAQGYGPALALALKEAVGDIIVTMDCDNTYPARAIIELVNLVEDGYEIVSASRLVSRPTAMPASNYIANVIFARLAGIICGVKTTDVHTGMRAYRKSLIQTFEFDPNGMALPVELLVGPVSKGYKYKEINIEYFERTGQSKLQPLPGTYWTLKRLWKWRRR